MNKLQAAEQFRKVLQMFAASLSDEQALEVATIYDPYVVGKAYVVGEYLTYGANATGDPQLYKVVQAHTSQADWIPDATPSLYEPIGLNTEGYPVWSKPSGAHDAYNTGDIVDYNGTLYQSTIDGNVYSPEEYPAGWVVIDVAHASTLDDPIPASRGMEYEYGKYYLDGEDGNIYLCQRTGEAAGGTIVLQYLPHELVGNYFEAV